MKLDTAENGNCLLSDYEILGPADAIYVGGSFSPASII